MTKVCIFSKIEPKIFSFHKLLPGLYQGFIRCNGKFSITPDEALVETRQKFVKEKIFGSILDKMQTFGHISNLLGLHHYSINSLLYLRTVQDKYITLYRELITQLYICNIN